MENRPSIGSSQHSEGMCRPCAFANTAKGCRSGGECRFCHYIHVQKTAKRPNNKRRRRLQKRVEDAMGWMEEEAAWLFKDSDWLEVVFAQMPSFLEHEPDVRRTIEKKLVIHAGKIRSV